jgi:uncharacterized protein (DUF433 family)/DNA-binding transcriptional MerR regulator
MAYSTQLTAALTGATESQLRYWRLPHDGKEPLLAPEYGSRPAAAYSYRDVVALRMFTRLRERVSLQKIRKAVAYLEEHLPGKHLSEQQLAAVPGGRSIVWICDEGDYFDVVERPGQAGIEVIMDEIFREFRTERGQEVPDLTRPAKGLTIDPDVRGGIPVAEGTRVTYNTLSGLTRDGLSVDQVRALYPWVSPESVAGATEFAQRVEMLSKTA